MEGLAEGHGGMSSPHQTLQGLENSCMSTLQLSMRINAQYRPQCYSQNLFLVAIQNEKECGYHVDTRPVRERLMHLVCLDRSRSANPQSLSQIETHLQLI